MIYFITYDFHGYTHEYLRPVPGITKFNIISYSTLVQKKKLARGTYVFTDRERLDPWELRVFSQLYSHIDNSGPGYRVLNNPAKAMNRLELLRMLYREGINDFNVYMISENQKPERYPVFIRRAFNHWYPLTGLLNNDAELEKALSDLKKQQEADEGLLMVEFCAEPVIDDLFHKFSAYRIGDEIFNVTGAFENNWLVKYGKLNSAPNESYREEYDQIKSNKYIDEILHIFDLANIEYGRMDYGIVKEKLQVYEINTNPVIKPPKEDHPNPHRTKSQDLAFEKYCKALDTLDTTDPGAPLAEIFEHEKIIKKKLFDRLRNNYVIKR